MYDEAQTHPVQYVYKDNKQSQPQPPRRGGCRSCLSRAFLLSLSLLAITVFTGVIIVLTLILNQWKQELDDGLARVNTARDRQTFETTVITDRNGEVLWEIFGEGNRTSVPITAIPQSLINATIAVEDDTFYDNIGVDAPSLIAALIANFQRSDQERAVGGSTITQQLVRHLAFDYEERTAVSYNRKTKEIVLAWLMTRDYTKDEILELYLNEIYYGNLAYGIEAAAQTYFEKSAADLTLAEASFLAALPQSPVELDPLSNYQGAKERQWIVLNLMAEEGYVDSSQIENIYLQQFQFQPLEVSLKAPHFSVYVRQQLEEQFGAETVANGGLHVTTSLDLQYQRLADLLTRQHLNSLPADRNMTNAALVALKPTTGEILAMVGSADYYNESIDGHVNITLSPQQPGSSIKPLTYAAALSPDPETGLPLWQPADILWDVPVTYDQFGGPTYEPVNYDGRFHGPVRLRTALANSYNIPALLLLQDITVERFLPFAQKMGINSWGEDASRYGLSLTLGGGEVTPLELTSAYAVFANEGYYIPPVAILEVRRKDQILYSYQPPEGDLVLDPRTAYLITDILDDDAARVPAMGRGNVLDLPFPAAAKTGTTNDFRDNWTVGYTPGLVVSVWTGNTDNTPMVNVSGLTGAAPLWSDYMKAIYSDFERVAVLAQNNAQPPTEFIRPAGLEERPLCAIPSITIGAIECTPSGSELFLTNTTPNLQPTNTPPADRLTWQTLEPAVQQIPAVPLPAIPVTEPAPDEDENRIPPMLYCHLPNNTELINLPPTAQPILFLSPPRNPESLPGAHQYAQANNLSLLPTETCNDELLALSGGSQLAIYRISTPKNGDEVNGIIPIVGTASFEPGAVNFYKIELGIPNGDNVNWYTIGETHNTPVVNGQLETLHAEALAPGNYWLRLIVVAHDGNYVGEPHTITFNRPQT
ncbi:MAG TPA: transglycosylase domain-containing protein [Anaerolineae bacterium]|nr:transglycosylase domain-containing protein [Anaerolineae bacterium]